MQELFKEKLKWFIVGGAVGGIAGFHFLFDGAPISPGDLALEYTAKFFGTIILTFVSGLTTVIAHDFYKEKLKHKLFKHGKRKKQTEKRSEEAEEGDNKKVG